MGQLRFPNPQSFLLALAAALLPPLLGVLPGVPVGYVLYLVCLALVYAIVALGLNLLIGYAGQFSLGHAGFLAIGAYASAVLTQRFGWPFLLALPAAGLLTAGVGFLLGLPALRLSGPYLALVTLGFGLSIPQLVLWRGELTGGAGGLRDLPPASVLGLELRSESAYYYLVLVVIVALTLFARNVVQSHTGRAFIAIRDSEIAAQAMGVNLTRYKTTAFALSAFYAGVAGSLYAHLIRFISPESFTVILSVEFLTMIVVGGLGSVSGSIVGALFLTALPEVFARLPVLKDFKNLFIVVFGAVLILTILFFPRGLAGAWEARTRRAPPPAEPASRPQEAV